MSTQITRPSDGYEVHHITQDGRTWLQVLFVGDRIDTVRIERDGASILEVGGRQARELLGQAFAACNQPLPHRLCPLEEVDLRDDARKSDSTVGILDRSS